MINLNIGLDQPMNGGSYGIFTFTLHRVESYPINRRRWGTTSRVPDRLITPVENSTKTRICQVILYKKDDVCYKCCAVASSKYM